MAGKQAYTMTEMKEIVVYLLEKRAFAQIRGRSMWADYEKSGRTKRTWQSLKETFLKRILPDIHNPYYKLTADEIASFRSGMDLVKKNSNRLNVEEASRTPKTQNGTENINRGADEGDEAIKPTGEPHNTDTKIERDRDSVETIVLDTSQKFDDAEEVIQELEAKESQRSTSRKSIKDCFVYSEPLTPLMREINEDWDSDSTPNLSDAEEKARPPPRENTADTLSLPNNQEALGPGPPDRRQKKRKKKDKKPKHDKSKQKCSPKSEPNGSQDSQPPAKKSKRIRSQEKEVEVSKRVTRNTAAPVSDELEEQLERIVGNSVGSGKPMVIKPMATSDNVSAKNLLHMVEDTILPNNPEKMKVLEEFLLSKQSSVNTDNSNETQISDNSADKMKGPANKNNSKPNPVSTQENGTGQDGSEVPIETMDEQHNPVIISKEQGNLQQNSKTSSPPECRFVEDAVINRAQQAGNSKLVVSSPASSEVTVIDASQAEEPPHEAVHTEEQAKQTDNSAASNSVDTQEIPLTNPCLQSVNLFTEALSQQAEETEAVLAAPGAPAQSLQQEEVVVLQAGTGSSDATSEGLENLRNLSQSKLGCAAMSNVLGLCNASGRARRGGPAGLRGRKSHRPQLHRSSESECEASATSQTSDAGEGGRWRGPRERRGWSARVRPLQEEGALVALVGRRIYPIVARRRRREYYVRYAPPPGMPTRERDWSSTEEEDGGELVLGAEVGNLNAHLPPTAAHPSSGSSGRKGTSASAANVRNDAEYWKSKFLHEQRRTAQLAKRAAAAAGAADAGGSDAGAAPSRQLHEGVSVVDESPPPSDRGGSNNGNVEIKLANDKNVMITLTSHWENLDQILGHIMPALDAAPAARATQPGPRPRTRPRPRPRPVDLTGPSSDSLTGTQEVRERVDKKEEEIFNRIQELDECDRRQVSVDTDKPPAGVTCDRTDVGTGEPSLANDCTDNRTAQLSLDNDCTKTRDSADTDKLSPASSCTDTCGRTVQRSPAPEHAGAPDTDKLSPASRGGSSRGGSSRGGSSRGGSSRVRTDKQPANTDTEEVSPAGGTANTDAPPAAKRPRRAGKKPSWLCEGAERAGGRGGRRGARGAGAGGGARARSTDSEREIIIKEDMATQPAVGGAGGTRGQGRQRGAGPALPQLAAVREEAPQQEGNTTSEEPEEILYRLPSPSPPPAPADKQHTTPTKQKVKRNLKLNVAERPAGYDSSDSHGYQDSDCTPTRARLKRRKRNPPRRSSSAPQRSRACSRATLRPRPYPPRRRASLLSVLPLVKRSHKSSRLSSELSDEFSLRLTPPPSLAPPPDLASELSDESSMRLTPPVPLAPLPGLESPSSPHRACATEHYSKEMISSNISPPPSPELSVVQQLSLDCSVISDSADPLSPIDMTDSCLYVTTERTRHSAATSTEKMELGSTAASSFSKMAISQTLDATDSSVRLITESLTERLNQVNMEESVVSGGLRRELRALTIHKKRSRPAPPPPTAKQRPTSTPNKQRKPRNSHPPTMQPVLEEHMECCARQARRSCPQKLTPHHSGVPQVSVTPPAPLAPDNKQRAARPRKFKANVIKVKITRPKSRARSAGKVEELVASERREKRSRSSRSDSGVASPVVNAAPEDTAELIHNHSESCLGAEGCHDAEDAVEPSLTSSAGMESNDSSAGTATRDTRSPDIFSSDARHASAHARERSLEESAESLLAEDEWARGAGAGRRASDERRANDERALRARYGAHLLSLYPPAGAAPDLSTVTESSCDPPS